MRRFILTVLAPLGDALATAYMLLMLNGFAWVLIHVQLMPEAPLVRDLAFVYGTMAILGFPLFIGYLVLLVALALIYGVPLGPTFLRPEARVRYLQEATA